MATTTSLPQGLRLFDATYELEGVLGQGGFGITYLAHHIRLGTKVAIKELYPEHLVRRDLNGNVQAQAEMQSEFESLKLRFNREAKTLQDLKHHSSTRFVAKWEEFGTVFIAMEFIDGETLEARIARGILLDEYNATKVMMSILFSLVEVHDKGLLHRDIKPANIILTPNGGVELIDFGSVTKFSANQRTKITSRLLTPAYVVSG
jgi:serine/threonine protein kinase